MLLELLEHRFCFSAPFGTPDATFGTGGFASIGVPGTNDGTLTLSQLAVDSTGNIYAGGSGGIARFRSSGAVDDSFGTAGLVALPGGDTFVADAVDPMGGVDVVLTSAGSTFLAHYTSAGVIDAGYGQAGIVQVTSDTNFTPTCITVQSDGKPIIAGTENTSTDTADSNTTAAEMRVFRLNTSGSADASFGTDGSLATYLGTSTTDTPTIQDEIAGVREMADNDILVGGATVTDAAYFAVARLTPSGALDSSYGVGGVVQTPIAQTDSGDDQYVQTQFVAFNARSDGSVVFAAGGQGPVCVAAADSSGNFQYDFVVTSDGLVGSLLEGVLPLNDGRSILVTGNSHEITGYSAEYGGLQQIDDVALTPIASDGTVGETATTYDQAAGSEVLYGSSAAAAVAPSGQLVVGAPSFATNGYSLEQVDEGIASAPPTDDFASASTNSIVAPEFQGTLTGTVDLAYYNTATQSLMFAQRLFNGLWTAPITVDKSKGAGRYISLSTDANADPSIAYYDSSSKSLKFATSTNGGVSFEVTTLLAGANVGLYPSLQYQGSRPELVFYDVTHGDLKYATTNSKQKWVITTVASSGNVGQDATIGLTSSGHVSAAYVDVTHHEIIWATQSANGKWASKVAAKVKKGADSLSMTYTSYANPAIIYHDIDTNELREAVYGIDANNKTDFSTYTFAADQGQYVSVVVGGFGEETDDDGPYSVTAPTTFAYSPSTNSVIAYGSGRRDDNSDAASAIENGGRYLTVAEAGAEGNDALVQIAYVDSVTGELLVRPFLIFPLN